MAKSQKEKTNKKVNKNTSNEVKTKKPIKINKVIIILIVVLVISIILKLAVKPNTKENNEEKEETTEMIVNDRKNVIKNKEVEGLSFSDVTLVTQNNETYLSIKVTNNNNSDYKLEEVHIFLKDKKGNNLINYVDEEGKTINYLVGYVGDTIKAGENRTLVSNIDTNITSDVYSIDYEITK